VRLLFCFLLIVSGFVVYHFTNTSLIGKETFKMDEEKRKEEEKKLEKLSEEMAKFYDLPAGVDFKDITEEVLQSPHTKDVEKEAIRRSDRHIAVFTYPSDGLKIKGLISYLPNPQKHPLIVLIRGGTGTYGVINPGSDLACFDQHTVISTMYRGGVSEGKDEYGGDDVNDVKNLIDLIPTLEKKLSIDLQNEKMIFLGRSRGGMQLFLTLARFPELQNRISKVISLSGLLDMRVAIADRRDIEEMFTEEFGFKKEVNGEEWINKRDPLLTVDAIQSDLPILIIQGTDDNFTGLQNGIHMVSKLQKAGKNVTYLEVEGGKHCLNNIDNRVELIRNWIER
jgi:dipeptidyl aminopeptidase/acylaminoacyl peptidase